ncbi:MAG TPA: hypothetical protein VF306_15985 [Pirellulales bacterium]
MRLLILTVSWFGLAFVGLVSARWCRSAPPLPLAPLDGVLLLRNGEVLAGRITHAGDYYFIARPRGDLRLRSAEVEFVAADLKEIYQRKRRQIEPRDAHAHLDLAEWCVQQDLLEQAAGELSEAIQIEPRHPRRGLVERRLELARRGELPAAKGSHPQPGPTNEDLDRLVRGMPSRSVEAFTSTVQPLLVNNCTTSGCHNTHSAGKLRLLRLPRSGPPSRRLTQRNLHAVWQVIDLANPLSSPLLTQPVAPHGTAKDPIFSNREVEQYRQLAAWVQGLAFKGKSAPPSDDTPADPSLSARPRRGGKSRRTPRPPPGAPSPKPDLAEIDLQLPDVEAEPDSADADEPATAGRAAPPSPRTADYEPVDAFDPEIFNRRFFAD